MRKPTKPQIVKSLVLLQYAGSMAISFMHIVAVGHRYGLTWEAWTAPFLIDGFMILGAIGRGSQFAATTRKTGLKLMVGAGLVSLACNVTAGTNLGQRIFGVLVVAGALTAEWYAAKLEAAPAPTETPTRKLDPQVAAERARKAAATRERNRLAKLTPAEKAAETRKRRAAAPVSPGRPPVDAPTAAQLDELVTTA